MKKLLVVVLLVLIPLVAQPASKYEPRVDLDIYFNPVYQDEWAGYLTFSPMYFQIDEYTTCEFIFTAGHTGLDPRSFLGGGFRVTWSMR